MSIATIAKWLQTTDAATAISQSDWMFPTIETTHVIAIALVVGSISILDLRLLGLSHWRGRAVTEVAKDVLPWTWIAFAVAVTTGSLMFISAASKYVVDLPFQLKMLLLLLAGANMLAFHRFTYPSVDRWNRDTPTPTAARIAGGLSLLFWIGIVACGRWVSFTTQEGPPTASSLGGAQSTIVYDPDTDANPPEMPR